MESFGYPFNKRKVGNVCLLPPNAGVPSPFHLHDRYKPGPFIRHAKALTAEDVHSQPRVIQRYDERNRAILFVADSILMTNGSRVYYRIAADDSKVEIRWNQWDGSNTTALQLRISDHFQVPVSRFIRIHFQYCSKIHGTSVVMI